MKTLLRNIWELDPDKAQNNSTDYSIYVMMGYRTPAKVDHTTHWTNGDPPSGTTNHFIFLKERCKDETSKEISARVQQPHI